MQHRRKQLYYVKMQNTQNVDMSPVQTSPVPLAMTLPYYSNIKVLTLIKIAVVDFDIAIA